MPPSPADPQEVLAFACRSCSFQGHGLGLAQHHARAIEVVVDGVVAARDHGRNPRGEPGDIGPGDSSRPKRLAAWSSTESIRDRYFGAMAR